MAHYILFPNKDAMIDSRKPTENYGLDSILELKKIVASEATFYNSRLLISFDINDSIFKSGSVFYLNLYAAKAYNLPINYSINVYAVSSSWDMGDGIYNDANTFDGVSWSRRTKLMAWNTSGSDYIANSGVSSSVAYDGSAISSDLRIDVTSIVMSWISSSYTNNGFLIKRPDADENGSSKEFGNLIFYSMDSKTVYLPSLEAAWDDSIYVTGSPQISTILNLSGSFLSGYVSGSVSGSVSGNILGRTNSIVTSSYSGSINAYSILNSFITQRVDNFLVGHISGNFSGSIVGYASGSITGSDISSIINVNISGSVSVYTSASFSGILSASMSNVKFNYFNSSSAYGDLTGSISGSVLGNISGDYDGALNGYTSNAFLTGSFANIMGGISYEPLITDEMSIIIKNLKKEYKYKSKVKFRLSGKEEYQRKTFLNTAASNFSIIKYLPIETYYSIIDAYTNRIIIPFSNYTKISCDLSGNYFNLFLNGFMPERFYKILFKSIVDGVDVYFDKNYIFKVVK